MGEHLSARELEVQQLARAVYEERLDIGVAREQARKDLPLSTYTEAYWKIDLHNLLHFLALRMDAHAQEEIRGYATVIGQEIVRRWCPIAWEAFEEYKISALTLSRSETAIVRLLLASNIGEAADECRSRGFLTSEGKPTREGEDFGAKLVLLGLPGLPSDTP